MAQITLETVLTNEDLSGGKRTIKNSIATAYTTIFEQAWTLSATTPVVAWNPNSASAAVTAFSRLYIESDGLVHVELGVSSTTTSGAFYGFSITKDTPLNLGSDAAYYRESTSAAFGNTAGVIDKIRLVNPTTSARVVTVILTK